MRRVPGCAVQAMDQRAIDYRTSLQSGGPKTTHAVQNTRILLRTKPGYSSMDGLTILGFSDNDECTARGCVNSTQIE